METLTPRDEKDVVDIIGAALANGTPIDIEGGGSRRGLGRPAAAATIVSTSRLSGVALYEPCELVLSALAGTPLTVISELFDQHGQELAFEPINHAALFGAPAEAATIGGMIAVNASGPRRIRAGAARDHLLGFRAVSGRGEPFKSGGRVMKNVTGYDMSKLMAGSYGTLGVLMEVTVKVLPKPETEATVIAAGLNDAAAIRQMTRVSGLALEVSSLAHLPAMPRWPVLSLGARLPTTPLTCFRLEGPRLPVTERCATLIDQLRDATAAFATLEAADSKALWSAVRDVSAFFDPADTIWRISTSPAQGAALVGALKSRALPLSGYFYDWAGGLIWLALSPKPEAHAREIRQQVDKLGGHATLIRADEVVRSTVPVFHPQPPPLAALSARVRRSFDPTLTLNRGRMREDL